MYNKKYPAAEEQSQVMGVAGIPGTFPTGTVLSWIESNFPHLKDVWNRSKVNDFYFAYKKLLEAGSAPWPAAGVSDKINAATGYKDALMFFSAVKKLIDEGKISPQWLMAGVTSSDPLSIVKNIQKEGLGAAKNLKWVGVLALAGVAVYFAWPWLMSARSVKKIKNKVR